MNEVTPRILVVDDEIEIRELLADLLSSHGFTPLLAADGAQMREHLAANDGKTTRRTTINDKVWRVCLNQYSCG